MDNHEKIEAPPDGMNSDDLATTLLYHMEVGRNQANILAAAEAIRIKSAQKNSSIQKAYIHIVLRWREYKGSEQYRSKYRLTAAKFLNEGDYDNPALWGGTPSQVEQISCSDPVAEFRALKRDRELHPENYVSTKEIAELFRSVQVIKTKKRMPTRLADIRPFTINPELNREKLEAQAAMLKQRDANYSTVGCAESLEIPKNNIPLQKKVLESMARDAQESERNPGNGQVVDPASPIRPGLNGLSGKLF